MSVQVNTTKLTFGALLGTVTTAAGAVNTTLGAITDGADMLGNAIKKMKQEQLIANTGDLKLFKNSYMAQAAQRQAAELLEVQEFRGKSKAHADAFDQTYSMLAEALKDL